MAEYSRLASGQVLSTGGQTAVVLPFTPTQIRINNQTLTAAAAGGVTGAWWYYGDGQGAAYVNTTTSASPNTDTTTYITANGFTTIEAALALQYGPLQTIGASGSVTSTNATTLTVVTTAAHGLTTGNWVIFQNLYATATTGMQQIAGMPFMVTVTSSTAFTVYWNAQGSNYTTITGSGSALQAAAAFKKILYPVLYAPGVSVVSAIATSGVTTTVTTTAPHNYRVGQEIAFKFPAIYGPIQLNELPNVIIPSSPQYFYVATVPTSTTFTLGGTVPTYTAYSTANLPFISFPGSQFPLVVAVGDINSGGFPYTGTQLYPSPTVFNGFTASTTIGVRTINGPGIQGGYINATFQGFIIGSSISGTATNVLDWSARLDDIVLI